MRGDPPPPFFLPGRAPDGRGPGGRPQVNVSPEFKAHFDKVFEFLTNLPPEVQAKVGEVDTEGKRRENYQLADDDNDGLLNLEEYVSFCKLEHAYFCSLTGLVMEWNEPLQEMCVEGYTCHPTSGPDGLITFEDIRLQKKLHVALAMEEPDV